MLPSGEIITCRRNENSDIFFCRYRWLRHVGLFYQHHAANEASTPDYSMWLHWQAPIYPSCLSNSGHCCYDFQIIWSVGGWCCSGNGLARSDSQSKLPGKRVILIPEQSLRVDNQNLGDTIFGIVPRSIIWQGMRLFTNNYGLRAANLGKYAVSYATSGSKIRQPHAQFHFLLDYVPNWKKSYGGGGLIQYQPFIPRDSAENAFKPSCAPHSDTTCPFYLGVLKRHRPDALMTHGLDGFFAGADFHHTQANRQRIVRMVRELMKRSRCRWLFYPQPRIATLRPSVATAYLVPTPSPVSANSNSTMTRTACCRPTCGDACS